MNGLPYYKAYPRDFIEGTVGMPFEIKCAYRVVLDLIYMQGGNLPDDARYISGLLGCSIRKWKSIRQALIEAGKITVSGDFLTADVVAEWVSLSGRPAIPSDIVRHVYERDGNVCVYCGCEDGPHELDHVTPWSKGGDHKVDNLVVSCRSCNRRKRDKTPTEMGWGWRRKGWAGHGSWKLEQ